MIPTVLLFLFAAQQGVRTLPADGWMQSVSGKEPPVSVQIDGQALVVSAGKPTHFALSQEIFLSPGTLWRAIARVKSSGSVPRMEIDTPVGGQGSAAAKPGGPEWQQLELLFRVPSPGRIWVRLIAFSNTAGKVWFDSARLEPVSEMTDAVEDVHVLPKRISERSIDLKQGGQFIEPLCRLTSSMIAQQVDATSFEEEPPWKPSYKREIDKPYRPWYPEGAVHLAKYSLDTENAFNGRRSQKIELPVAHSRAGISQDGFYIDADHQYRLRLHMRSEGNVKVRASLHGEGRAIAGPVDLGTASRDWQGASAILRATSAARNATLTIEFEGPGTLWLDRVYMIDVEAVLGLWRPDVVNALKALNPGVIRFGGSTLEVFEWDKCLGDWDLRAPYVTEPWGGLDPNFVGVEEFIQLTRYVNAEPLICVRWTGKTPQDAASEVEYFNGAADTHWGRVRAQNGHVEPYRVKYWQIGNEIGGAKYDESVKAFAEAMKRVDPNIKILSSFPSAETLKLGGGYLDYLCPHHYEVGDLQTEEESFQVLQDQIARYANGRDVRVAVTEWNTTAGWMGLTRGILLTLGNALSCSRYQNLMHRYSGLVEIAIRSNLSDSFGSGIIQPGAGWLYRSPTYHSQALYQRAAGSFALTMERSNALVPRLREPDLSATLSADGKMLRIYAVNSTSGIRRAKINLSGIGEVADGQVFVLGDRERAGDSEAMNSHDDPDRVAVSIRKASVRGREFEYAFEPFTLTLLELELK
jgi:alpha-L-arabinofuranosidase